MRRKIELPFYMVKNWKGLEGELYHKFCAGEILFKRIPHGTHKLTARCERCNETFQCDMRTLKKQFLKFGDAPKSVTRKELARELQTRPLYPVSQVVEVFDYSDRPALVKDGHGMAMLSRDPAQPQGKIIGVFKSGHFEHLPKANPPKRLLVTKSGGVRGKRTRPPMGTN